MTVPDHDAARALPPPVMDAADLTAFLAGAFPDGVQEVVEVTGAGVVMRFPIRAAHQRPGGTVSGPTLMAAADAAAWMATLARIGPVALAVTSNLTINFLRKPSLDADLWARAELLKLGRRLSVCDVRLYSGDDGDPVAQATVTYAIPAAPSEGT